MRSPLAFGILLVALVPLSAAAQPDTRGPYTPDTWDAGLVAADLTHVRTQVVFPTDAPAPGPIVLIMHGNARNGSYHMELARTFASRGLVAVVPDMPCGIAGCDHVANARQVLALLDWAAAQGATSGSRIEGRVDPERRALVGHSWGGLGTFLAASTSADIDAWVGLDPEEDLGAALRAAPTVMAPGAELMAAVDGVCNGDWRSDVFSATTGRPHMRVTVATSGHCDPEEPTDGICDIACTAGSRSTTPIFRRYAVAFVMCALGMDASMQDWIGGASFEADRASGVLTNVMSEGLDAFDCGGAVVPGTDAGIAVDAATAADADAGIETDAGAPDRDAGAGFDASAARDASAADASGGPPPETGGCACRAAPGRPLGGLGLSVFALGLWLARRWAATAS